MSDEIRVLPAVVFVIALFVYPFLYGLQLSFQPQPVITEDNLVVNIDTVIYFQVTDPVAATYEIANYISAIEQLTMTTLRMSSMPADVEATPEKSWITNQIGR